MNDIIDYTEKVMKEYVVSNKINTNNEEDMSKAWSEGYHRKVDEINGNKLRYFDEWLKKYQNT